MSIPQQRSAPGPGLETRPKQVKRWIESLPLDATFESGRKLCRQLALLNRVKLEADARLEILAAYEPVAAQMLGELEAMYAKAPLPLPPAARTALGLTREFLTELAVGYRVAAVELGAKVFASRKQLTGILFKAMRATAGRMFAAYKSYTPAPNGTWADLHELYLRADELGVARESPEGFKTTIADTYCDALLLSLTDPYRLNQGESERVLQLLRGHRGLATLGQARPRTPAGGHFLVPCNADKPPKPSIGKLDDTGGPDWRLLDANPVVDALRAQLAAADPAKARAKGEAPPALIAKLVKLWGDPPKRTSRRDPGQETVAITMGLGGVGHFIAQESRWNLAHQDKMLRSGITMPLAPLPLDDASQPIPVFEWDVVNQSRGGLRVRRTERTEQPIAVGEVAGIRMPGKPNWAVGAVRWVTVFEDGGMEFGLQYLAATARSVLVKAWGAPSAPGLLLAHEDASSTLLTSPKVFQRERQLELEEDGGDASLIHAGEVVEVTSRFEIFTVKAAY